MKIVTVILLVLILGLFFVYSKNRPLSQQELLTFVLDLNSKELNQKYRLEQVSRGGGVNRENKERLIILEYLVNEKYSIDEARKLIIACIDLLLSNINSNSELLPYLAEVPFKPKNVEFAVFFRNHDYSFVYDPDLRMVTLYNNKISYVTIDPENDMKRKSVIKETYDEALEKVKAQIGT